MEFTVVILALNHGPLTRECVTILRTNASNPIHVLILDNGSTPEHASILQELADTYVALPTNVGVIPAMNVAWPLVTTPYVAFIHNDLMILEPDWDLRLNHVLQTVDHCGVVGVGGGSGVTTNGLRFNFISNMVNAEQHGSRLTVDHLPAVVEDGMCLVVAVKLLQELGGIGVDYKIHHFYDLDICLEAIYHGYKVLTLGLLVDHLGGETSVREDYNKFLTSVDSNDLKIHAVNMERFDAKWSTRFPIHVDANFNYTDKLGTIREVVL